MAERQHITEEDQVHLEWYKQARKLSVDELPEFTRRLLDDYHHDYGTCCHAVAAIALASASAANKEVGLTGFQAGQVMWQFVGQWLRIDAPLTFIDYTKLLYPQYEENFRTISPDTWQWAQEQVQAKLAELEAGELIAPRVLEHWKKIAEGVVPFGLKVSNESP